jgi:TolB-like protein
LSYLLVPQTAPPAPPGTVPGDAPPNSVAVLPFENIGGAQATDYFAEGVSEEVLDALAAIEGLSVAARTSAFTFRNETADIRSIAEALGVRHVVEGSVRRQDERLRVTARLVDASSGYRLWSDRFEGDLSDVFAFQDEIALRVAEALRDAVGEPGLRLPTDRAPRTTDLDAYDDYLLARHIWRQRGADPIRRSIALLEDVVARDPEFVEAWTALASANLTLVSYTDDFGEAPELARVAAHRALALDESQAEAHTVLASLDFGERAWLDAEVRYQRALALAPSNSTVHMWYAEFLITTGRIRRANEMIARAIELDPLYGPALSNAGRIRAALGRHEEALDLFERAWTLGLEAMFVWFGKFYTLTLLERYDEAEAWLEKRPRVEGIAVDRAMLNVRRGRNGKVRAATVEAILEASQAGMDTRDSVSRLMLLDEIDAAHRVALAAARAGWSTPDPIWGSFTDGFRADPRFPELVRALELVAYWRVHGPPDGCILDRDTLRCGS